MTGDAAANPRTLPASLDYADIEICSHAKLFGTDMDDPGVLRFTATVTIHEYPDDEEESVAQVDGIGLSVTSNDCVTDITVLRVEGLILDRYQVESAVESLDADSAELVEYACLFAPGGNNELDPDLESRLKLPIGSRIVILERVRVAPAWRGCGGVGRYLTGRVLSWVIPDATVIAAQPFPLDVKRDGHGKVDDTTFKSALKAIQRVWKSIGFEPFHGDIWILDPSADKHERAMARLERKLNVRPGWSPSRR
jgi:hypothetical protein